jgi:ABC-2 type transport system permease protein
VARGIIMIACGITFPILVLPNWLKVISYTIPFTHGIEAARKIMLNGYTISQALEPIMYTIIIGLVYVLIGYLFFKYLEHVAKVKGSFDRY